MTLHAAEIATPIIPALLSPELGFALPPCSTDVEVDKGLEGAIFGLGLELVVLVWRKSLVLVRT